MKKQKLSTTKLSRKKYDCIILSQKIVLWVFTVQNSCIYKDLTYTEFRGNLNYFTGMNQFANAIIWDSGSKCGNMTGLSKTTTSCDIKGCGIFLYFYSSGEIISNWTNIVLVQQRI